MYYTAIFHGCKNDNFQMKNCDVFLSFAKNIDCGYSLEPPYLYTTHNLISIIAMISKGLTAISLPLRYSITFSVCIRFHRNLQW